MITVLIPMASRSSYFPETDFPVPVPLINVGSKLMIELVLKNFSELYENVRFIFVISRSDCNKYHLDKTLKLLTNGDAKIVIIENETKGAACSALMALDHIDLKENLIISNSDQIFERSALRRLKSFDNIDAGVLTFNSVHPRWSYVAVTKEGKVVEAAEKKPLSNNAIAGLYFFKQGKFFVDAAKDMILKGDSVNGLFYIAPVINQIILSGKMVIAENIDENLYHGFYNTQKIKEYENFLLKTQNLQ